MKKIEVPKLIEPWRIICAAQSETDYSEERYILIYAGENVWDDEYAVIEGRTLLVLRMERCRVGRRGVRARRASEAGEVEDRRQRVVLPMRAAFLENGRYGVGGGILSDYERIMRVSEVNLGQTTWVRDVEMVRCRDCLNMAVAADGSRYCAHWSRRVPLDGYCHLGERKEAS